MAGGKGACLFLYWFFKKDKLSFRSVVVVDPFKACKGTLPSKDGF
jgi:hypothetical protein